MPSGVKSRAVSDEKQIADTIVAYSSRYSLANYNFSVLVHVCWQPLRLHLETDMSSHFSAHIFFLKHSFDLKIASAK